jgi:uncharacterized protein YecE (DUF72 family)
MASDKSGGSGGSGGGQPADGQLPLFGPGAGTGGGEGSGRGGGGEGPGRTSAESAGGRGPETAQIGVPARAGTAPGGVRPAAQPAEIRDLAARLPPGIHLGGSTWSFPGWAGLVYDRPYPTARLAREGLSAYARHPLLRAVGIDRTHYRPLPAEDLASYAAAVPDDFLFLVKAHEACTLAHFPDHPRYGAERGQRNPLFLDPAYAAAEVVASYASGLGAKGGALLFQFAPQDLGPPRRFAARLQAFLTALPQGPQYAVELRNRELLTADYAAALAAAGACHCLNVHPRMPDVRVQAHLAGVATGRMTLGRWLLGTGATYEGASKRFAPFNRLRAPDPAARRALAELASEALAAGRRFLLTVNNNAEGSAPLSIAALAREVLGLRQPGGD